MNQFTQMITQPGILGILLLWSFFWKGWALWTAATKKQFIWFVLLLIVNTFGILEILYIFFLNKWDIDDGKTLKFLQKQFGKSNKKS